MADQQVVARSIVRSSLGVAAISLVLLALNLAAQAAIASRFGISGELDAYWLAFTIAISLAGFYGTVVADPFLPRFVRIESSEARDRFASAVLAWTLLIGVLITAAVLLAGPAVGRLAAPGFDAAQDAQARRLILLLAVFPALLFLVSFATGLLSAAKVFAAPRAVALAGPAAVLLVVVTQSARWGVEAIAAGALLGGVVQTLLLAVLLWRGAVRIRLTRRLLDPAVRGLATAATPMFVSAVAIIVGALIDRSAASTLGAGSVSVFSYGEGIQSRLLVLLFLPIATVVYPYLAEAQREDDFNQRFAFATRFALALLVPVAVFTGLFSELAVDILLRRGAFTLDQTRAVAPVLAVFMAGLIPYALSLLAIRGVLVRGRLWQLSAVYVVTALVKAAAMPWFARQWGVEGIAGFAALSSVTTLAVTVRIMFGSFAEAGRWLVAVLPYAARIAAAVAIAIAAALAIDAVTPFEGELVAGPDRAPPGLRALTSEFVRLLVAGTLFLAVVALGYQRLGVVTVRQIRRGLSGAPRA